MREKSVVIPEIEHLVDPVVYDLPEHTVTISHIGDVDFVGKSGLRLGQNTAVVSITLCLSGKLVTIIAAKVKNFLH